MSSEGHLKVYCNHIVTNTFVADRHFEWYTDDSHKVLNRHQRAQYGTNTQSFAFPLVDELKRRKKK